MKCLNCSFENSADAKFCEHCGKPMERACPNCAYPVSAVARFCKNCGFDLKATTPSISPQQAIIDRYVTSELATKLAAARTSTIEGERRIVTILFADIKGSTAMAEQLDPEEWAEIMNRAFEFLIEPIYRYEGIVARLMGDAILAFFGAPIAHEDDPQRGVLAALAILEGIGMYRAKLQKEKGLDFGVRIGLNTGLVVVGNIGTDLKSEYTAMGDAINLASRMQTAAEPNTILIAQNTARAVRHAFDLESYGALELKGKSEPVPAFRVIGRKAVMESARGIEGLDSPLVGRESQMQTLLARLADLKQGRGHIIAVMGEAGLGKSRLIAEVRKAMNDSTVLWLEGRSLSFQTQTPYAPFIDLLTKVFDLHADESDIEQYTRISANAGESAPFLATLLNVKLPASDVERVRYLEPPQLRERIFSAIYAYLERCAAQQPTVLVLEDLHWADPTSLDLAEHVMPLTERTRLLLMAILRPQRHEAAWRFHETAARDYAHGYTPLFLEPLTESESRTLVANLLHIEDLPEQVRALILKKAEGNPFFVEEVIRSLLDSKLVVRENDHWRATREIENIAIPDTLAGVISARLDRLDAEAKRVAQTAAVIGREFQYPVLAEISEVRTTLETAVLALQRRELIREKSRQPQMVYLFKHVLTQQVAYASMLLSKRRELHQRVAECLERTEPERVNDIAYHWLEAQAFTRALPYLVDAGTRAAREYSTPEAIAHFSRAIGIIQTLPPTPHARRAYEGLGNALTLIADVPRALENYQAMLAYAQTHNDAPMQVSALNKLAMVQMLIGDFENVEMNLRQAENVARAANDLAGLAEMFTVRCGICNGTGDFDGAIRYLGESIAVGRELDVKEQMAFGLTHTASTFMFLTKFDEAWQKAQEAMRLCEEIGDRQHQAELFAGVYPFVHICRGELDTARAFAEQGVAIGQRIGSMMALANGHWMLGTIARLQGEYQSAVQHFEQSINAGKMAYPGMDTLGRGALGLTWLDISSTLADKAIELHTAVLQMMSNPMIASMSATAWADIGFSALQIGNLDRADEMFQKGLNYPTTMGLMVRANFLLGAAYVALARQQLDAASQFVNDASAYAQARAMTHLYPSIALADARVSAARGEHSRALDQFASAERLALDLNMRPLVWQACADAAKLLEALNQKNDADAKRRQARAVIDEMAALFTDTTMREMFVKNAMIKT
jgi:class 3 adenylate cyclase/tetratricopeptide (TPR) repeat protein